jgi:hypothetical protein
MGVRLSGNNTTSAGLHPDAAIDRIFTQPTITSAMFGSANARLDPQLWSRSSDRYSASVSPDPPSSVGKSLSLGRPSFIGSTVDS